MPNVIRGSTRRPRKDFPYYKVQSKLIGDIYPWRDFQKAFQELDEAKRFLLEKKSEIEADGSSNQMFRIMKIDSERKRYPLEDSTF